jgi:predicted Zn-dependent protease
MPHADAILSAVGDALLATGQPGAAIVKYQAAIAENPHTPMAWRGWGTALAKCGRYAEAQEKLERAAREDPLDPAIFRAWADVLEAVGRVDEARSRRDEALRLETRIAAYAEQARRPDRATQRSPGSACPWDATEVRRVERGVANRAIIEFCFRNPFSGV